MFRWADHVDADHVQRIDAGYDELAASVSGLRHHAHGNDVGVSEGTFDYLVVADFDSVTDWRAYRDHPTHVLLVEELITGHVVDRATGQFQLTGGRNAHDPTGTVRPQPRESDEAVERPSTDEADDELFARARQAAMAEMQALLAEPDEPT